MENRKDDNSLREEASAFGERIKGAAKDAAGSVTGNRSLEREGELENEEGRARQAANDVGGRQSTNAPVPDRAHDKSATDTYADDTLAEEASAAGQRAKGAARDIFGDLTGNERLEREGERENARGRARQAANEVFEETEGLPGTTRGTYTGYVSSVYDDPESAQKAYEGLTTRHGYSTDDISVVMSDETRKRHFGEVTPGTELSGGTKAAEGFGKGSAIGGGVGAALGAIFALGTSIVVPGLGIVVAGPIAAALAGAGAGGATGGLIGLLVGAGIPKDRAETYERAVNEGGIVLGTRARNQAHAEELEREFHDYGGRDTLR